MFLYQKQDRYFAQVAEGLEELGCGELKEMGAEHLRPVYRGIHFEAEPAALYRINYQSRILSRILAPLISFECHNTKYLHKAAGSIPWAEFFGVHQTFAVFATVSHSKITHSQFAARCVKDAIVDQFREKTGDRPNVNPKEPDVWINLHLENNRATLNWDTSGGSLHRRDYRIKTVEAPMQETVAAAIIRFSEWDGSCPLYDPMCGSGTLLAEALLHYRRIPSQFLRNRFGFEFLPEFNKSLWLSVRKEAEKQVQDLPKDLIAGSDISREAVRISRTNLRKIPGGENIHIDGFDFKVLPGLENRVIVCNPPYGIRLQSREGLSFLYKSLGDFLKQKCKGSTAYIFFGEREWVKNIGLKPSWKKPLKTGGLDGRLLKFEIY